MTSLHGEVQEWLWSGAKGLPARDLAVHAAFCPECLAAADGLDALRAVDVGAAEPPSRLAVAALPTRRFADASYVGIAVGSVLVIAAVLVVQAWPLIPNFPAFDVDPGRRIAEEILSGAGAGPAVDPTAASASDEASATDSAEPQPTEDPDAVGQPASLGGSPIDGEVGQPSFVPVESDPATPPPDPTLLPSVPVLPSATPIPTPVIVPTAPPTPVPTPSPEPTPAPPTPTPDPSASTSDCDDGIDNDGDRLIDVLDPGCVLDRNEASI